MTDKMINITIDGEPLQVPAGTTVLKAAEKLGINIVGGAPQQLADQQKADFERWGKVIKAANIKLE